MFNVQCSMFKDVQCGVSDAGWLDVCLDIWMFDDWMIDVRRRMIWCGMIGCLFGYLHIQCSTLSAREERQIDETPDMWIRPTVLVIVLFHQLDPGGCDMGCFRCGMFDVSCGIVSMREVRCGMIGLLNVRCGMFGRLNVRCEMDSMCAVGRMFV
jgi:hypothetical protein